MQIWTGTFLGGPLVAGYMLAENFKAFNEAENAKKTWYYSVAASVLLWVIAFSLPATIPIPNQLLPLVMGSVAYYFAQQYQGEHIKKHINSRGKFCNWFGAIAIAVLFAIPQLVVIILLFPYLFTK